MASGWAGRKEWDWLRGEAYDAVVADIHHRHGLHPHELDARSFLRLARFMLNTPGTYTHSMVAIPERERLLEEAGLVTRLAAMAQPQQLATGRAPNASGSMMRHEARDAGGETQHQARTGPVSDRWRELAERNGVSL